MSCNSLGKNNTNLHEDKIQDSTKNKTANIRVNSDSLWLESITEFPTNFCDQDQLLFLSIMGNDCDYIGCKGIGEMPQCIGSFSNLEELQYGVTGISFIPDTLRNLKNLRVLSLNDNSALTDIKNIGLIVSLEAIGFYGCGNLKNIDQAVKPLKNLKSLSIIACYGIDESQIADIKRVIPKGCKINFEKI